jgi:hypothetical protein
VIRPEGRQKHDPDCATCKKSDKSCSLNMLEKTLNIMGKDLGGRTAYGGNGEV